MSAELIKLVQHLGQPYVLVVGDLMLDRYIWGDAERISQEAPVILLHADKREERLGAPAAWPPCSVPSAPSCPRGVVGADASGERIRHMVADLGVHHEGIITDASRPSTVKERYYGRAQHRHPQQMIRVDYEQRQDLSATLEKQLCQIVAQQVRKADIILISDYGKGLCTAGLMSAILAGCRNAACGYWSIPTTARIAASTGIFRL